MKPVLVVILALLTTGLLIAEDQKAGEMETKLADKVEYSDKLAEMESNKVIA